MLSIIRYFHEETVAWCRGRSWLVRLPLLIFFAYLLTRYLKNSDYCSIFWGINFFVHEAGHVLFRPFGWFLRTAGGTILQCLFPIGVMVGFIYYRDFFGVVFCWGWLSTNLFDVSRYMASTHPSNGIAINPFGNEGLHDWFMIFNRLGVRQHIQGVAASTRNLAIIAMLICLVYGGWLLWLMYRHKDAG